MYTTKKTQDEFLAELRTLYGETLNYEDVHYNGARTPVTLHCKEHGKFSLTPNAILSKHKGHSPCPVCGIERKNNSCRSSIEEKRERLYNKFTDVILHVGDEQVISMADKTTFLCKDHGNFTSSFKAVLNSANGCPDCNLVKHIGYKDRIRAFETTFPESGFTFDKTVFNNVAEPAIISCKIHGDFSVPWRDFIRNKKCPTCEKEIWVHSPDDVKLQNLDEQSIREVVQANAHAFTFVKAIKDTKNWSIIMHCPVHGNFKRLFNRARTKKLFCPRCRQPLRTVEGFSEVAKQRFGDRFEYKLQDYDGPFSTVDIICPEHGKFTQMARVHVKSATGCPSCSIGGYKKTLSGLLYVLYSGNLVKIGITNNQMTRRLREINGSSENKFEIVYAVKHNNGNVIYNAEQAALKVMKKLFSTCEQRIDGASEIFVTDDVPAVIAVVNNEFQEEERKMFEGGCD